MTIGTSGKREIGAKTTFRHFTYPWEMAERLESFTESVSLVFGEEGMGLSTESLALCDFLVTLPTWEGYPIANLSHAVNACVYELHRSTVRSYPGFESRHPQYRTTRTKHEPHSEAYSQPRDFGIWPSLAG